MNDLLRWLLDLNSLDLASDTARLGFERPLPGWAWPGVVGASLLVALWSYRRLDGPRTARLALGILRGMLLTLLVVLIAGPRLVERDERIERDWVLVLVDRSASLTIADADGQRSREEQLRSAISAARPALAEMARERDVLWLGFDAGAYELAVSGDPNDPAGVAVALGEPTGRRTDLARALEQALQRAAARPLAGVVILSDGRSIGEPSRATLRRLQAERVPIVAVPLGSAAPVGDLAVRSAEGPGVAFINDLAPVRVEIDRLGAAGSLGGRVRLIDRATGLTLDEQRLEPGDADTEEIVLTARPTDAGRGEWRVELVPDGPDLIPGNNAADLAVNLIDRPLRALYIDGVARWEQRYLKNLLLRERTIISSNLILAPNRRYLQEGDRDLTNLPISPEEWAEFDVVILGDVRPEVFTAEQLASLREHVAVRGGGLIWIGGEGATPDAWRGTPLADLLPFSLSSSRTFPIAEPIVLAPTVNAERLGVLRLGATAESPWPSAVSDPAAGWSQIRWAQRIERRDLKPATEILAVGLPVADLAGAPVTPASPGDGVPLVMSMRFGAGRSLYVATDETWRWRYGRGEALPERFWLQMVRLLARESLSRSQRSAVLAVAPRQPIVGEPARVVLELLDQNLVELDLASVTVRVRRSPATGDAEDFTGAGDLELSLRREPDSPRRYSAMWAPSAPGDWRLDPADAALAGLGLGLGVRAVLADDELRRPESDHALLASLAEATEGVTLAPGELDTISQVLPNRQQRIVHETEESLWDTPLALVLLILLLTGEWVGRRIIRLI